MITLPSGIKKYEPSDNATVDNFNANANLLDEKIAKLNTIAQGAGTAGSATDAVIGNRTIDDAVAAAAGADTPTRLWSKLAYMIKAITGKANWYTAPATTLEATKLHIDATTGIHGMTPVATPNRGMQRDGNGNAKVAAPIVSDDIATKQTVDDHANLTAPHGATSTATASRLVFRDLAGRSQFTDPTADQDAATKIYVDARTMVMVPSNTQSAIKAAENSTTDGNNFVNKAVFDNLPIGNYRISGEYRSSGANFGTEVEVRSNGGGGNALIGSATTTSTAYVAFSFDSTNFNQVASGIGKITVRQRSLATSGETAFMRNIKLSGDQIAAPTKAGITVS